MEQKQLTKKLSKAVLELKFMKKSKEKIAIQEENDERQQLYQDQLQSLHKGADQIVIFNSYVDCMDFLPARLSFGGMDPDVEKLNEDKLPGIYKVLKPEPKVNDLSGTGMNTDVSVEEMANQYNKRKSDHLDEDYKYNPEEMEEDCEQGYTGEGVKMSNVKPLKSLRQSRGRGRGKDRGGRGNFRGRGRGYGGEDGGDMQNFRGRGRGYGGDRQNFRGRGRGNSGENGEDRQNFRGKGWGNRSEGGGDRQNYRGRGRGNRSESGEERHNFSGKRKFDDRGGNFKGKGRGNKRERRDEQGGGFRGGDRRGRGNFRGKQEGGMKDEVTLDFTGNGQP